MVTMLYPKPHLYLASALLACVLSAAAHTNASAQSNGRDFIVTVVDAVPITNHEVMSRAPQLQEQLQQQGRLVPQGESLLKAALERLIVEKALLQHAKENGIVVEEDAIDQAEQFDLPISTIRTLAETYSDAQERHDMLEFLNSMGLNTNGLPT
jgi:peptidyl-prolyl cis-trans isomerase SurA